MRTVTLPKGTTKHSRACAHQSQTQYGKKLIHTSVGSVNVHECSVSKLNLNDLIYCTVGNKTDVFTLRNKVRAGMKTTCAVEDKQNNRYWITEDKIIGKVTLN